MRKPFGRTLMNMLDLKLEQGVRSMLNGLTLRD